MTKAKILFFESGREARLLDLPVEDGSVVIENKEFIVDTAEPLLLRSRFGYQPLYILKWNSVQPSTNIHIERVNPEFEKSEVTPEMLKKMMNLKILGNMIKTKKPIPNLTWAGIGLFVGILLMYALIYFNVLPIK